MQPASLWFNRKTQALPRCQGQEEISFIATKHTHNVVQNQNKAQHPQLAGVLPSQVCTLGNVWFGSDCLLRRWEQAYYPAPNTWLTIEVLFYSECICCPLLRGCEVRWARPHARQPFGTRKGKQAGTPGSSMTSLHKQTTHMLTLCF